jgi:hypothetical protein
LQAHAAAVRWRVCAGRTPIDMCIDGVIVGNHVNATTDEVAVDIDATLRLVRGAAARRPRQLVTLADVKSMVARELSDADASAGAPQRVKKHVVGGSLARTVVLPQMSLLDIWNVVKA